MSRTIDERVVQMTFDNQDFERGAKQTINTLDKLKTASNTNAFGEGLAAISDSARKINLNPLINGFQSVGNSVSLLETIATGALLRLGTKVADFGVNVVKNLSVAQIANGWQKYAEAIASEQTIMSAVAGKINPETQEVYGIDAITERISKLQWYTDETSYNISQMTNAIGSFTSTGIDLDVATQAIIGISNACADAGVSTQKAESAFIAFSRAIGTGNMTLGVWNMQMKTSGLTNSERFKQSLLDAAEQIGTIRKISDGIYKTTGKAGSKGGIDVTLADIASSFNAGKWATSDVMIAALNSYSDTVDRIYDMSNSGEVDTASEAIAKLTEEYQKAGKEVPKSLEAFRRAQEAISFEQAIQSVRDAVSSKWSQTFELIFGNYEEAKDLWTTLANEMWDWFASTGDERNELLRSWHEGVSEFQNQLDTGDIDSLEDQIEKYKKKIDDLTKQDFIANALTEEQSKSKIYTAFLTRDAKTIGETITDIYKQYEKLPDDPLLKNSITGSIEDIVTERDKLIENEKDEAKQLKIIEDYNTRIGELVKQSSLYESAAYQVGRGSMMDSEKRVAVYEKLQNILKNTEIDTGALDELLSDEESLKIVKDLMGTNTDNVSELIQSLSNMPRVANLETAQKTIKDLFDAIDNSDQEKLLDVWKDGYYTIYQAFGGEVPQKIKDLQTQINDLTSQDKFSTELNKLKSSLVDATGATKTEIEQQISFYEGLNKAISSDSISDYYKSNQKAFDELYKNNGQYAGIVSKINQINKDSEMTEVEKTFALAKQYELLTDLVKSQSNLDEATEKQKELEKELVEYFIEGKNGYDIFVGAIKTSLGNITNIISTIREAFRNIFPQITPLGLINLTQSFADFIDRISLSEEQLEKLGSFFERIFGIGKNVLTVFQPIWAVMQAMWGTFLNPLIVRFKPILEDILVIFENLSTLFAITMGKAAENMSPVRRVFADIMTTIEPLVRTIQYVISWIKELTESWLNATDEIAEDNTKITDNNIFSQVLHIVQKAFEVLEQIVTGAKPFIDFIKDTLGGIFKFIGDTLSDAFNTINDVLGKNNFNAIGFAGIIAAVQQIFSVKWGVEQGVLTFDLFGGILKGFKTFGEALSKIPSLVQTISEQLYSISSALEGFWNKAFTESLKNIGVGLLAISAAIFIISSIPQADLDRALGAIATIALIITAMMKLMGMIKKSFSEISTAAGNGGFFSRLFGVLDIFGLNYFATMMRNLDIAATILAIAIGMVIISSAMKIISTIPEEQFGRSLGALLAMMAAMYLFILGINKLEKRSLSVKKWGSSMSSETGTALRGVGKIVEKIAFGLLIVAAALKIVSTIPVEVMGQSVFILTWMLTAIGLMIGLLGSIKISKTNYNPMKGLGKTFEQIAFGLLIVAAALKLMENIEPTSLVNSVAALSFMLLTIGVFMNSMANITKGLGKGQSLIKIGASILILSIAIGAITAAVAVMAMIPLGALTKGVAFLGIALAEIWMFCQAMSSVGTGTLGLIGIAGAMLIFSSSLVVLSVALAGIGMISTDNIMKSMLGIAATMVVIGTVAAIFSNGTILVGILAFSAAFLAIGAAVMMVGIGLSSLVPLLMLLTTQTSEVAEAIQVTLIATFETMLGLIPSFVIALVNSILEFVGLLVTGFAEKVPELLDGLANLLNSLADGIRSSAGTLGAALGNLASALIEGIITALYEAGKSLLGGLWDWIVGDSVNAEALTESMSVKMGMAGEESSTSYIDAFKVSMEENSAPAIDAAESVGETAAEAMEDTSDANNAAYNTVLGYTSFLTSGNAQGMVSSAFSGLGFVGIGALKAALGIKSPSRVMAEQGMYTVLGLVNGIYDNIDYVDEAGTDTANALLNAMHLAAENAESILEDDMNPVITPILDLSNLEENSGVISSLLGEGSSYRAALAVQANSANSQNQNGVGNPINVNVSFTINEAGRDLTEADFTKFGRQIADIVNQELGGMIS